MMADPDNSKTLHSATRQRLLPVGVAAKMARPFDVSTPQTQSSETSHEDPTLRLCEKWQEAHNHTLALCRKHGALEAELVRVIGFPSAPPSRTMRIDGKIRSVDDLSDVWPPEGEAIRDQAIEEPDEHQARWDALDNQIGYSRMDSLIRQSEATERALLADILLSPAATVDGMLAKLSVILCEAENRDDPEDFPWPHIRSLRNDLTRLHAAEPSTIAKPGQRLNSKSR